MCVDHTLTTLVYCEAVSARRRVRAPAEWPELRMLSAATIYLEFATLQRKITMPGAGLTNPKGSDGPLVIVPCGKAKIWDRRPETGAVAARLAYTGYPFRVNVAYAERFAGRWVILSARYGFIAPDFSIPEPYDASFNAPASQPVSGTCLRWQADEKGLTRWCTVVGLGGRHYRAAICSAFHGSGARIRFPFAGLPIGKMIQATKRAIETGVVP